MRRLRLTRRRQRRPARPAVRWDGPARDGHRRLVYRGPLAGEPDLWLHVGVDGWQEPIWELPLTPLGPGEDGRPAAVAELPDTGNVAVVDLAVRAGDRWDNNHDTDYRLWTRLEPVDGHVHARQPGLGALGSGSLRVGLGSVGIRQAVVCWRDNRFVERLLQSARDLRGLVWVRPDGPSPSTVRRLLRDGWVGLKLHPDVDDFDADDPVMDRHLRLAARMGVPAAVHSAPGRGDPDRIRRLAERHPDVTVVLYHTYLGPYEGRRRAVAHALEVPNLVLETSWCRTDEARWIVDQVGADRVMFGSDAAVDGPAHYTSRIVENAERYTDVLLALARELPPDAAEAVLAGTARRVFGLAPSGEAGQVVNSRSSRS